jgi:hypothetical protein
MKNIPLSTAPVIPQTFLLSSTGQPGASPQPTQLLIKAYHGTDNWRFEVLQRYMTTSLAQYQRLKTKLQLPVAEIYNESMALQQGVFLVEYVPEAIDPINPDHLAQVHRFFERAIQHSEMLDLLPENFRVQRIVVKEKIRENGVEVEKEKIEEIVKLIDFMEDLEEDELVCCLTQALGKWIDAWRSRGIPETQIKALYSLLTANFEKLNPLLAAHMHPPASLTAFGVETSSASAAVSLPIQ